MPSEIAKRIANSLAENIVLPGQRPVAETIIDRELAPLLAVVEAADENRAKWDELGLLPGSQQCQKLVQALVAYHATQQPPATKRGCEKCHGYGTYHSVNERAWLICSCLWERIEAMEKHNAEKK